MKLSKTGIETFKKDSTLKNKVAAAAGKSESTVRRWVASNHTMLTTESCLSVIEKETGIPRKKLLTSK